MLALARDGCRVSFTYHGQREKAEETLGILQDRDGKDYA